MSATAVTRRDFARLAIAGAGAAVFGCSEGILAPEKEIALRLSGTGRLFDEAGRAIGTQELAPGIASGPADRALIRPATVRTGVGRLRVPAPDVLAFAASAGYAPQVFRWSDRARDGTVVETVSETLGKGIPWRRTVRVPKHGVVLTDTIGFRRSGNLSVFEQRTIRAHQGNRLVAEVVILGEGEIRVSSTGALRALVKGSPLLPGELSAQNCGIGLLIDFIAATLAVIAALGTCGAGPWCVIGLTAALIEWAQVIGEMERCRET
jgi:hypothetical protein